MAKKDLMIELFCPTGKDALLIADALMTENIKSRISQTMEELLRKELDSIDVILIAEEALQPGPLELLNDFILKQEPWSEIPVILLTSGGKKSAHYRVKRIEDFIYSGNVTLLERPLQPLTLLSATKVAMRARQRQYQVRDLLLSQIDATKIRDEFISIASHELKTPLTSLKLQTQLSLKTFRRDGPNVERMFKQIDYTLNQINRLNKLVDDMLDISRIGTGKLRLNKSDFNLSALLIDMLERFSPQFELAGCQVKTNIEPGIVGNWDAFKIEQVVNNLFSNAIRYAAGSPVTVKVRKDGNKAILSVADEGQGIHQESLERIFERFERATTNESGLGLGLYITRQIILLHEGSISVKSEVGKGSCFTIELPL